MIPYSFLKENGYDGYDNNNNNYPVNQRRKVRRNWHVPQSRSNARPGTVGSFSSITSMYNNVYSNQNNDDFNQEDPYID